jgi:hypothetical protein
MVQLLEGTKVKTALRVAAVLVHLIIVHHLLMMVEEEAAEEAEDAAYHNITKKNIL